MRRERLIMSGLMAVGLLNILPGMVALWPERAVDLYGLSLYSDAWALVMRHRAILLALVGLGLLSAILQPAWRLPAVSAALISKISFIGLWALLPAAGPALDRVAHIDMAVLPILLLILFSVGRARL